MKIFNIEYLKLKKSEKIIFKFPLKKIRSICQGIYRVADLSEDIEISQKLSPANKNVSDKSCMVSRGT